MSPGRAALIGGTGHRSDSWAAHTEAFGARVLRTAWSEGLPIDPDAIEAALFEWLSVLPERAA